ncbi:MAG: C45 family peptidase [Thermoplasmata archaeon]|nr:C45 family peptidase [Thermoplasmata archaeon]
MTSMIEERRLKTVEVSGTYESMGSELGSACKPEVQSMLSEAKDILSRKSLPWDRALLMAGRHASFVMEYNPNQLSFLNGYSKGSGLSFDELFLLFCLDEKGLCTDVMVNQQATDDESVFSAHTEDWSVKSEEFLVLVKAKPKNGPAILVMTHAGLEWITGINSAGISATGNSLYQSDVRFGVPKLMVAPKILASETLGDALGAATPAHRASSYNNNICHSSGEMYCVEGSATDFALMYPENGYLVHTNHYIHPAMAQYETAFGVVGAKTLANSSTITRYHRARRLVRASLGSITADTLMELLRDHFNYPASICRHPLKEEAEHDRCKTTYATVIDLTRKKMLLCVGNPCEGEFKSYSL